MASMQSIPDIVFDSAILRDWGVKWRSTVGSPKKDGTPTTKNPEHIVFLIFHLSYR